MCTALLENTVRTPLNSVIWLAFYGLFWTLSTSANGVPIMPARNFKGSVLRGAVTIF